MGRKRKLDNVINVHSLGNGYLPLGDAQRPESRLCRCLLKLYFGGHIAASTIQEVACFLAKGSALNWPQLWWNPSIYFTSPMREHHPMWLAPLEILDGSERISSCSALETWIKPLFLHLGDITCSHFCVPRCFCSSRRWFRSWRYWETRSTGHRRTSQWPCGQGSSKQLTAKHARRLIDKDELTDQNWSNKRGKWCTQLFYHTYCSLNYGKQIPRLSWIFLLEEMRWISRIGGQVCPVIEDQPEMNGARQYLLNCSATG